MSWLNTITYFGITKVEDRYIRKKIVVANVMGVMVMSLLALPFVFICLIYYPQLVHWPVLGVVLSFLAVFVFIRQGLHLLGRIIVGIVPVSLATFFAAEIMSVDQEIIINSYLLAFSLMFMPALVFDVKRELGWLALSISFGIILLTNFDTINAFFETNIDDSLVRDGWLGYVSLYMAIVVGFCNIIVLSIINKRIDEKAGKYIRESKEKNKQLEKSEGELQNKLVELEARKVKESKNTWVANGLATTGDILRENRADLNGLAEQLVQYLAKYIKASNATLFIREDGKNGEVMAVKATYAYDRDKMENLFVTKEDGLVGQCWKDGAHILVRNLPENYVKINSGLGNADPKSVLIMPFKDEASDKIEAIFELSSFQEIDDLEILFLEKLGGGVASAIKNNKTEELTAQVLKDAQEMSQELREQEEELRQNAEEMMATQEELEKQLEDSAAHIKRLENELGKD